MNPYRYQECNVCGMGKYTLPRRLFNVNILLCNNAECGEFIED